VGKKDGYGIAKEILRTGKAEKKLREIISLQGGDADVKLEDLVPGEHKLYIRARKSGQVLWIDNNMMIEIARAAGSPKDKGAGILLSKKHGDKVHANDVLFTVYAAKSRKISRVEDILSTQEPIGIGDSMEMFIHKVEEAPVVRRAFVLDR
jgi:AMP phosphorylase